MRLSWKRAAHTRLRECLLLNRKVDYPQTIDILFLLIYTISVTKNYSVLIVYIREKGERMLRKAPEGYKK